MAAPNVIAKGERDWLDQKHPLWEEMYSVWDLNEARAEGIHRVIDELWPFDWEPKFDRRSTTERRIIIPGQRVEVRDVIPIKTELRPGEHYARRQDSCIYVNFPTIYDTEIVGGLIKERPIPTSGLDFGTMGEVRRKRDIDNPTLAELLYYNTNGVGSDGSQWDSFWATQIKASMHTGYRWIMVESPRQAPVLRIQQLMGLRPYLVGFSSKDVTNWHYVDGQLAFAIIRILMRNPRIGEDGRFTGNDMEEGYYLLVKKGYDGFGQTYRGGGWWMFTPDKEPLVLNNRTMTGNWDRLNGDIPLFPLFYEEHPRIFGRPATTELGNAAIALMNVDSAACFDAWDSAGSVQAVRGTTDKGFNLFIKKVREGNRYAPLIGAFDDAGKQQTAGIQDLSTGAVVADVFEKRVNSILRAVDRIKSQETFGTKTSGLSEQAGYIRGDASRLAILAGNVETCQNSVIAATERRAGNRNPTGSTSWTRDFKLIELTTAAQALLQLERIAGISSEELDSTVILAAATDQGMIPDNEARERIKGQLSESAKQKQAVAQMQLQAPQVPGDRKRDTPPEPAQTNRPVKDQLDGPEIP